MHNTVKGYSRSETDRYLFDINFLLGLNELVVVAFPSLARIWGECLTIHSPPALFLKVEIS